MLIRLLPFLTYLDVRAPCPARMHTKRWCVWHYIHLPKSRTKCPATAAMLAEKSVRSRVVAKRGGESLVPYLPFYHIVRHPTQPRWDRSAGRAPYIYVELPRLPTDDRVAHLRQGSRDKASTGSVLRGPPSINQSTRYTCRDDRGSVQPHDFRGKKV